MSKAHLSPELLALLQLSASNTSEIEFEAILRSIPAAFNWNYFLERAIATNLAGYLLPYPEIAEKHYPTQIYHKIKSYQQRILLHSIQLLEGVKILNNALNEQGIQHAFLKGCSQLIRKEANLKMRQVSDIDLLIDPKKQQEVSDLLKRLGATVKTFHYKSAWHAQKQLEHAPIQAVFSGLCIDVHIRLFRIDAGYRIDSSVLFKKLVHISYEGQEIPLLDEQTAQLFTILHAHKHLFFGTTFKVGSVNDLYLLNWPQLKPLAYAWSAQKAFHEMEQFCKTWFENRYEITFLGQTTLRFLSNRSHTIYEKAVFLRRRLIYTNEGILHPMHIAFKLFPQKSYLNTYFGAGPYLFVWWRRFKNLFRF